MKMSHVTQEKSTIKIKQAHTTIDALGLVPLEKTEEILVDPIRTGMSYHSFLCGGIETSMLSWKQPVSLSGP